MTSPSPSVLHSLEHTKRFTELGREVKGEVGDRGDLMEKKESQKGERAIKPVITLPSKNVLKIGFLKVQNLITNTKKQRLKIWSKGCFLTNAILKKKTKSQKL